MSVHLSYLNDTSSTDIYTLSLHDALPICVRAVHGARVRPAAARPPAAVPADVDGARLARSEEHTSELQSLTNLVCRLLLEKKKKREKLVIIELKVQARRGELAKDALIAS